MKKLVRRPQKSGRVFFLPLAENIAMGQSSSGELQQEMLYAEDGVTVIGSTFSIREEDARPLEWFGMGPQSGFVGPGPQINPKIYCMPHSVHRRMTHAHPSIPEAMAAQLAVFNRSKRPVKVCLGLGDASQALEPGEAARIALPAEESTLYVMDPFSGACLCDLPGLPKSPVEVLPRAVVQEVGGVMCAALEYSTLRTEAAPDPSRPTKQPTSRPLETNPEVLASEDFESSKASSYVIDLELQLLEALQKNNQETAQKILQLLRK